MAPRSAFIIESLIFRVTVNGYNQSMNPARIYTHADAHVSPHVNAHVYTQMLKISYFCQRGEERVNGKCVLSRTSPNCKQGDSHIMSIG